jgi:hypothetical protein
MATRNWTLDQRQRQATAIRKWQPWTQSTGAKTKLGKLRSSQNAWKGGTWREIRDLIKTFNQAMKEQRSLIRTI